MDYYKIGERIRKYRRMQELTQEKAAEQTNLSQKYFSRLERGQGNPTAETLYRVAKTLNISLDTLIEGERQGTSEICSMVLMLQRLDTKNQQRMLEIMKRIIELDESRNMSVLSADDLTAVLRSGDPAVWVFDLQTKQMKRGVLVQTETGICAVYGLKLWFDTADYSKNWVAFSNNPAKA